MKLFFACSRAYEELRDEVFLRTLCDPWELCELRLDDVVHAGSSWRQTRSACYSQIVRQHAGEVLAFSDVDVQWFRPAQPLIDQAMEGSEAVFLHGTAHCALELGFVVVRCTPGTVKLFNALAAPGSLDREILHRLVVENKVPCSFNAWPSTFATESLMQRRASCLDWLVLYHAGGPGNSASDTRAKLRKHQAVAAHIAGLPRDAPARTGEAFAGRSRPPVQVIRGDLLHARSTD